LLGRLALQYTQRGPAPATEATAFRKPFAKEKTPGESLQSRCVRCLADPGPDVASRPARLLLLARPAGPRSRVAARRPLLPSCATASWDWVASPVLVSTHIEAQRATPGNGSNGFPNPFPRKKEKLEDSLESRCCRCRRELAGPCPWPCPRPGCPHWKRPSIRRFRDGSAPPAAAHH